MADSTSRAGQEEMKHASGQQAPLHPSSHAGDEHDTFDEPDDELEEFDEIGGDDGVVDTEVAQWDEDWDAAGWDDEDVNDDFCKRLQQELEAFKQAHPNAAKAQARPA
ncbi:hypothetical protein BESB_036480 [Besnoitia besnoiti]|uniref:DSS1/SEM1 family protein n=1 Tax=Besnoitia besnoiti TaxID=94643 RepID=A0A2A9MND3_BESBE|nr:hypothetical protein BESB_036480 [Besnoitia besnoiti]PFH37190.1 hypothetical protein BESB_036480 [Besnoitia besnoiti]